MSLYLGKIHYWLFNKILWFEKLEGETIKLAQSEGLEISNISNEIKAKYGEPLPNKNLEDMIDTSNIHGWLQDKIHSAEGRMASWTYFILKSEKDILNKLEELYIQQGIEAAKEVKTTQSFSSAKEIYNSINDYILDGMPCDRVNEVSISEDNLVEWSRRIYVHKDIWQTEGVDVSLFYKLRNLWVKSFVNEINSNFEYTEKADGQYSISIKK